MENLNLADITRKIFESKFMLLTRKSLGELTAIKSERVLSNLILKLVSSNILTKLEKNKYVRKDNSIKSFNIANLIYSPSYISFDTALNYHGVLAQFPYEISSATTRKSTNKNIEGFLYTYTHFKTELFFGYYKQDNMLIAEPEKALLDQIYLALKGFKRLNLDEYDYAKINKVKLKEYFTKYPKTKQTQKMAEMVQGIWQTC